MGVPDTDATTLSDPNNPEYLSPPLIRNKLIAKRKARANPIFWFCKIIL